LGEIQRISPKKTPVVCTAETSIKEAAQIMHQENVGSIIIVNEQQHPIGIITDRDLRNKVVAATLNLDTKVEAIMSSPVITAPPDCTVADVQMMMMRHRIHHLCITSSGKPDSQIQGIISEHDLLVVQANNPAVLIREIQRAQNTETLCMIREKAEVLLHKYLLQEVAINFISKMMTEINDALIQKAILLAEKQIEQEGLEKPNTKWCWLALGSEGRCEQLLRTDQDNALLYEDVPEQDQEAVQFYFQALAGKITQLLNECGFEYCPGDMMASNPKWCKTLSQWKNQFYKWIVEPTAQNIMYCNIFFDFRGIYGDINLADQLHQFIVDCIEQKAMFLPFLASDAIRISPLLTFFRNFVVEKSGEHKDQFDIKGRAMMPLADAARVLILEAKEVKTTNTIQRFRKMAEIDPVNQELFIQAAEAYEILMRFRALQGLKNKNSGRYFKPTELSKMQRLNLRNSFKPIHELQGILKIRFRLNLMI
jgi:CBS domain-containing protein